MGLNTKCPIHGNEHPDFMCPCKLANDRDEKIMVEFEKLFNKIRNKKRLSWKDNPHVLADLIVKIENLVYWLEAGGKHYENCADCKDPYPLRKIL